MKKYIFILLLLTPISAMAMANPASTYCVQHGGVSELRQPYGFCEFTDGSECEEAEYYTGVCSPGQFPKGSWETKQPTDPDFIITIQQAGWVADKLSVKYVDKEKAAYFYYRVAIQNRNYFSKPSNPVSFVAYSDPIQTFSIPSLKALERSDYFDIYIPVNKKQQVDLAVNPDRTVKEVDYSNNTEYDRPTEKATPTPEKNTDNTPAQQKQVDDTLRSPNEISFSETKQNNIPLIIMTSSALLLLVAYFSKRK